MVPILYIQGQRKSIFLSSCFSRFPCISRSIDSVLNHFCGFHWNTSFFLHRTSTKNGESTRKARSAEDGEDQEVKGYWQDNQTGLCRWRCSPELMYVWGGGAAAWKLCGDRRHIPVCYSSTSLGLNMRLTGNISRSYSSSLDEKSKTMTRSKFVLIIDVLETVWSSFYLLSSTNRIITSTIVKHQENHWKIYICPSFVS